MHARACTHTRHQVYVHNLCRTCLSRQCFAPHLLSCSLFFLFLQCTHLLLCIIIPWASVQSSSRKETLKVHRPPSWPVSTISVLVCSWMLAASTCQENKKSQEVWYNASTTSHFLRNRDGPLMTSRKPFLPPFTKKSSPSFVVTIFWAIRSILYRL